MRTGSHMTPRLAYTLVLLIGAVVRGQFVRVGPPSPTPVAEDSVHLSGHLEEESLLTPSARKALCFPPQCKSIYVPAKATLALSDSQLSVLNAELLQHDPPVKTCHGTRFYPICFGVLSQNLETGQMPHKTRALAPVIAGDTTTYLYKKTVDEYAYMRQYRLAAFGHTKLKSGWDCNRHYEILSQYSMPWFEDLEHCPTHTLSHLPKQLLLQARDLLPYSPQLHQVVWPTDELSAWQNNSQWQQAYSHLMQRVMHYTRLRLTTSALAEYMLRVSKNSNATTVLFISYPAEDYMSNNMLHGFTELLGRNVHVYQAPEWMYRTPGDTSQLYGRGFGYAGRLPQYAWLYDRDRIELATQSDVEAKIQSHAYDLVVFGAVERTDALLPLVRKTYDPQHVLLLDGDDIHSRREQRLERASSAGHYFLREIPDDCERL